MVVDTDGQVTASATVAHVPFASAQTGWAEQDPRDWWRASMLAIRQVLANEKAEDIGAIGLSGQMHGAGLLNARDEVLRYSRLSNRPRSFGSIPRHYRCGYLHRSSGGISGEAGHAASDPNDARRPANIRL